MNRRKRSFNKRKTFRRKWSGKSKSGRWYREQVITTKARDERRINDRDKKEQN